MRKHHDVVAHFENGDYGVKTMRKNQPEIPVYTEPESWPVQEHSDVDVVYGNPPCAPFSNNSTFEGDRSDAMSDERIENHRQMIRVLKEAQPRFWVFESVTQAYDKGGPLLAEIEDLAEDMGYNITHFFHDVNFYGNPQSRKRYFCILHDTPLDFEAPDFENAPTVGDVLGEITAEEPRAHHKPPQEIWDMWKELIPKMEPGEKLRHYFVEEYPDKERGRPLHQTRRLDPERPAWTAIGGFRFIHPTEDRLLASNEMSRLQGFPEDYEFIGTSHQRMDLISRGVATEMGEYLGKLFAEAESEDPVQYGVQLVDFRQKPGRIQFLKSFQ
jgi:DNA (cytosine-5)-methyltransferase 1